MNSTKEQKYFKIGQELYESNNFYGHPPMSQAG